MPFSWLQMITGRDRPFANDNTEGPGVNAYGQLFLIFLVLFLTPDNEHMCSETDFTQEEGDFLDDHL